MNLNIEYQNKNGNPIQNSDDIYGYKIAIFSINKSLNIFAKVKV